MQGLGEGTACVGADTAVLSTPAGGGSVPLVSAGVEDTDTAAGNGKVELIAAEVTASVGSLDNHGLASNGGSSESEPSCG